MNQQSSSGGILFESVALWEEEEETEGKPPNLIDLDDVCMSSCGGPFATLRQSSNEISVYAGGGSFLASWTCPKPLLTFKFTQDLLLVLICLDGCIYVWDEFISVRGENGRPRLLCDLGAPLLLATVHNTGLVLLTSALECLHWPNLRFFTKSSPQRIASKLPLLQVPRCMAVMQQSMSTGDFQLAIGIPDQSGILLLHRRTGLVEARIPGFRQIRHEASRLLVPHSSSDLLVSLDLSDHLLVTNSAFDQIVFAKQLNGIPAALDWIMGGAGFALSIAWQDAIQVVGLLSTTTTTNITNTTATMARFEFDGEIICTFSEFDGLKLLVQQEDAMPCPLQHYIIRRVPQCVKSCLSPRSTSLAHTLFQAVQAEFPLPLNEFTLQELAMACDELLDCIKFTPKFTTQLLLFKACQLGRHHLVEQDASLSYKFAMLIRLANALHRLRPGLTSATMLECLQYTLPVFASRLLYLGFDEQVECFYNTAAMVASGELSAMRNKIAFVRARRDPATSVGLCSSAALGVVRRTPDLCDKEEILAKRMIALLHLREYDRVLHLVSTLRGIDFDLKSRVAFQLLKHLDEARVAACLVCEQAIRATFRASRNTNLLERWILTVASNSNNQQQAQQPRSPERGLLLLETALQQEVLNVQHLDAAAREFDQKSFYAVQTLEFIKLLAIQRDAKLPSGRSVGDTLVQAFARSKDDVCERIRDQFQVKPSFYARCRLLGFAARNQFIEAARAVLGNEFKMQDGGISMEDVIDLAFERQAHSALSRIALDVLPPGHADRARIFLRLKMFPEALRFAEESACLDVLEELTALNSAALRELRERARIALQAAMDRQAAGDNGSAERGRCHTQ